MEGQGRGVAIGLDGWRWTWERKKRIWMEIRRGQQWHCADPEAAIDIGVLESTSFIERVVLNFPTLAEDCVYWMSIRIFGSVRAPNWRTN